MLTSAQAVRCKAVVLLQRCSLDVCPRPSARSAAIRFEKVHRAAQRSHRTSELCFTFGGPAMWDGRAIVTLTFVI